MASPTERTIKLFKSLGFPLVAVVEKWNAHAHIRQDLFGIGDILAIGAGVNVMIQASSSSGHAERVRKCVEPKLTENGADWTVPKNIEAWLHVPSNRMLVITWGLKGARGKRKTYQWRATEVYLEQGNVLVSRECTDLYTI